MSEISHIPISRCSAVSRLDRIRTLWRSMLPPGCLEETKMRCLQLRRASSCSWPPPSVEWRWGLSSPVWQEGPWHRRQEKKRENLGYEKLYNLNPSIHGLTAVCSPQCMWQCFWKNTAVWVSLSSHYLSSLWISPEVFEWCLRPRQCDTWETQILLFFTHHPAQAKIEWRNHNWCNTDVMLSYSGSIEEPLLDNVLQISTAPDRLKSKFGSTSTGDWITGQS